MAGTGVRGVTVVRGRTTVLDDVTLLADDGELLVVLGPSGSGKSTLLRAVGGLDEVTAGEVFIKGRPVTGLPSRERRASMVFQAGALIPFLDVARNLGWGLRMQHRPDAEVEQRVTGRARQLRIGRLLPRRPDQLSGGEQGLVGIGRALVQTPDVFLLDEPLGDLDAVQRDEVRRQIVDAVRSLGVATFYVTHDPIEGLAVADRVAVLDRGHIVQVGRPRELYERPADVFVAEFIGSPQIGLLPARLVTADGLAGFEVGARTLPLWRPLPAALRDHLDREVLLGLRAEDVHAGPDHHPADSVTLDAVITHAEYTGRQTVIGMVVDGPGGRLHALLPPDARIRPGDVVRIAVDATRAHVFDPGTGRALWHPADADERPAT
jgi:multiple sugar transport system ATP-binding protein